MPTLNPITSQDQATAVQQNPYAAVVQVGSIDGDNSGLFANPTNASQIFTDYRIRNTYIHNLHRYMAGVTSPGGFQGSTAAFFQLAAPTLLWIADWTACRFNSQPDIPTLTTADSDWVLLGDTYETHNPQVGPDNSSPLYRITGQYIYGHKKPNADAINNVVFGIAPYLIDGFSRTMPASLRRRNLIDTNNLNLQTPIVRPVG